MSLKFSEIHILPNIAEKLEQYATNLEKFPIYEYERCQTHWGREPNPLDLLNYELSPISTTLKVERDPFTGEIQDFREVPLKTAGATAQNSMLLNRAPIPPIKANKGAASFVPFLPGSFPSDAFDIPKCEDILPNELLTIPPGFTNGLVFDDDGVTVLRDHQDVRKVSKKVPEQHNVINLLELAQKEQDSLGYWSSPITEPDLETSTDQNQPDEEEFVIPKEPLVLNISNTVSTELKNSTQWAVVLDSSKPVKDFHEKIPDMACKFEFELDPFQKLAIIHLEKHNHVFVAAHTSAGKTVVAEYAIALSQKHLTRTIYTSPIKALSNQKYRDFKEKFQDVGLITGDFQNNEKARCLIMTTEILKSMLYSGSDLIRDLEYVIFDEVHYINDRERGHVWEQVLILLPKHVSVVLLSATVPKPEEFADWLGRIHKKKVYVITTPKRPVPLEHFLYTGTDGKTKDNRFSILKGDRWLMEGYIQAKNALPDPDKRTGERFNEKQDKTLWISLISHLKSKDLLPVVCFTFSRKKCDNNAKNLSSVDLTTQKEKSRIERFYRRSIGCLKEVDRMIPQVEQMRGILVRGVGVHHSGVLPIIKEIVEMLFQKGLIKLLFATETFAMGVNMPARTVVFDSIRKHDGLEWRDLESAEYIQMAGRAGRRGQDDKGTVIILCKNQLPAESSLKQMMMGRPHSLQSKFKLTYSMVLSLLRLEGQPVERMMARSFLEADNQKKLSDWQKELDDVKKEIKELCKDELSSYLQPLVDYFDCASEYLEFRAELLPKVFNNSKLQKALVPGRILLISHKNHMNKLGMLLTTPKTLTQQQTYKVLILTEKTEQNCDLDKKTDLWYKMLSLASDKVYCPEDHFGHDVVDVASIDVLEILGKTIKTTTNNPDLILSDWNKRQLERFKNDPPGQTTAKAVQELHKLSLNAKNDRGRLDRQHFVRDLGVNESDLYCSLMELYDIKEMLNERSFATKIPNFLEQFSIVFEKKYLEKRKNNLEHLLSSDNLSLYEGYKSRIELLKSMDYITKDKIVEMKGKVACQMGMNELLITELIMKGILMDLTAAEIAALLSTLVFQVRTRNQGENEKEIMASLSPNLQNAIKELKKIHDEILNKEAENGIRSDDIQEELNLGVIKIVHEWASNKSFAEIMQHTEYQEGIIVRCIQQLNDTICDIKDVSKIVGNPKLKRKMEEASDAIKRDIVFTTSLYTRGGNNNNSEEDKNE